jgi:hypothetical protein
MMPTFSVDEGAELAGIDRKSVNRLIRRDLVTPAAAGGWLSAQQVLSLACIAAE